MNTRELKATIAQAIGADLYRAIMLYRRRRAAEVILTTRKPDACKTEEELDEIQKAIEYLAYDKALDRWQYDYDIPTDAMGYFDVLVSAYLGDNWAAGENPDILTDGGTTT